MAWGQSELISNLLANLMAYLISYFDGLSKSQEFHLHLYLGPILVECEWTSVFGGVCQNFKAVVKKK